MIETAQAQLKEKQEFLVRSKWFLCFAADCSQASSNPGILAFIGLYFDKVRLAKESERREVQSELLPAPLSQVPSINHGAIPHCPLSPL